MKATRTVSDAPIYNPTSDLERIESKLTELCFIAGISADLESITIDELIAALRVNYRYTTPLAMATNEPAATDWLRKANFNLVIQARKYWWNRQLAKGAQARG
jgi:hypothetical protein